MAMLRKLSGWALVALLGSVVGSAAAQNNATRGKQLYELTNASPLTCSNAACHGVNPLANMNKIQLGANNPVAIINAIANIPQMQFLDGPPTVFINTSNTVDASDLAAYIANPAAAAAAPAISLSAPALAFGATTVGMTSSTSTPTSITLTNSGNAPLTITGIGVSGTNAAEFAATGTCRPVAPATSVAVAVGATCTIGGSFTPTATGNRTATFTLQSNAAAAASPTIAVSGGTAGGAPAPAAVTALSTGVTSLKFNLQMVSTVSAVRTVVLTNVGSTDLTINQVSVTPAAFISSGCSGTFFPRGGQCTIQLYFAAPSAVGTTSGSISIVSDSAGSPHTVTLSGGAVTTPTPDATLSDVTLTFDPLTTGQSGNKTATLTNLGNAPLMINGVSLSGPNAAEFKLASTSDCAAGSLAVSASCKVAVDFTPTAAGAKSATATVTHNASGGSSAVALSGTATAAGSGPGGGSAVAPTDGGGGGWSPAWLASLALVAMIRPRRRRAELA